MRHRAKFHQNRSIGCGDMAMFSKWRPSAILDFQNSNILTVRAIQTPILPHCADIAIFVIFKMAAAAILDFQKVEILSVGLLQYVILPNFLLLNDARTDRQTDGQTVDGRSTVL